MRRREKKAKAQGNSSSGEDRNKRKAPSDDEANEDLSLKIVQKSIQRGASNDPRDDGVSVIVTDLKKKKETRKRKKTNESESPEVFVSSDIDTCFRDFCGDLVDNVKGEETSANHKATKISVKSVEGVVNPVEVPDDTVLKKLLRGPRYFDPPDSNWGACYNCGEEGHTIANCTSAKRKKPCFVCGGFEHNAKQCTQGRDCFICKQHGHRAKDCPEKYKSSKLCLKCGDFGHEMFSCMNDYNPNDIKDMQCYICQKFGHLCCAIYSDYGPTKVSCYRCGLSGHTGLACMASYKRDNNTYNTTYVASSCYKCGVEGHFARECTSSIKTIKRNRELSTPKRRPSKKIKERTGPYSAPHDLGKPRKVKKPQFREFASPSKLKQHGRGWTTEYPEDYYYSNQSSANNWRSPGNSSYNRRDRYASPNRDYASPSHSSRKLRNNFFTSSPASGSPRSYQGRNSASRFSYNNGNDSRRRNNDWW